MTRSRTLATFAALGTLACQAPAQTASTPGKPLRIGYSQCNRNEPWREHMDKDIKGSAEKFPEIKLTMKDAQNDAPRQMAHVKEFMAAKVDVLIISPLDTSLSSVVGEAFDAGIPVIVLDRAVLGDKYTCFIGADNRLIGAEVGKWVKKALDGKGNVVELKGPAVTGPVGSS